MDKMKVRSNKRRLVATGVGALVILAGVGAIVTFFMNTSRKTSGNLHKTGLNDSKVAVKKNMGADKNTDVIQYDGKYVMIKPDKQSNVDSGQSTSSKSHSIAKSSGSNSSSSNRQLNSSIPSHSVAKQTQLPSEPTPKNSLTSPKPATGKGFNPNQRVFASPQEFLSWWEALPPSENFKGYVWIAGQKYYITSSSSSWSSKSN